MRNYMKKWLVAGIMMSMIFFVSSVSPRSNVLASTQNVEKLVPSSNMKRNFTKDGEDVFQFNLTKTTKLKFAIKDAQNKKIFVVVLKGMSKELLDSYLNNTDDLSDKELDKLVSSLKLVAAFDNETGSQAVGSQTAELGLTKGTYTVVSLTTADMDKKKSDFTLAITPTSKSALEIEPNDSIQAAQAIKNGHLYKATTGYLLSDVDYYKVNVQKKGTLVLKSTTNRKADMSYNFYDANKKRLPKKMVKKGNDYVVQTPVKKGTYYVRVSGNSIMYSMKMTKYNLKTYVKTTTPTVNVINKKGSKKDMVIVRGVTKGTKVNVFSDAKKKNLLISGIAKSSILKLKPRKLNDRGGKLYINAKTEGLYTSSLSKVSYKKAK